MILLRSKRNLQVILGFLTLCVAAPPSVSPREDPSSAASPELSSFFRGIEVIRSERSYAVQIINPLDEYLSGVKRTW